MKKLIMLCACMVLLTGCMSTDDWTDVFKEMREDCDGIVSYTLTHGNWSNSVSMTCTKDVSDD